MPFFFSFYLVYSFSFFGRSNFVCRLKTFHLKENWCSRIKWNIDEFLFLLFSHSIDDIFVGSVKPLATGCDAKNGLQIRGEFVALTRELLVIRFVSGESSESSYLLVRVGFFLWHFGLKIADRVLARDCENKTDTRKKNKEKKNRENDKKLAIMWNTQNKLPNCTRVFCDWTNE